MNEVFPSKILFEHLLEEYTYQKEILNRTFPFSSQGIKKYLFIFLNDIKPVSKNCFMIDIQTRKNMHSYLLVQKTYFSPDDSILAVVLYVFNQVMKNHFSTITRNIQVPINFITTIGEKYTIFSADSSITTISKINTNSISRYSTNEYFDKRLSLVRSFSVNFNLNYIFGLTDMINDNDMLISLNNSYFPLNQLCIGKSRNPIEILPKLAELFGKYHKGEIILSMSSISQVFINNIESIKPALEIYLSPEIYNDKFDFNKMNDQVNYIEDQILKLCPPQYPGAIPEDSVTWFNFMNSLIIPSWG